MLCNHYYIFFFILGPSGIPKKEKSSLPSAPDLQLDWLSSSTDSDGSESSDTDDDSGIEVLSVQCKPQLSESNPVVVDLTQESDEEVRPNPIIVNTTSHAQGNKNFKGNLSF